LVSPGSLNTRNIERHLRVKRSWSFLGGIHFVLY
jgi:hypothetical protein